MARTSTAPAAPAHALAHVAGWTGAVSVVRFTRGYDVLAGSVSLLGVPLVALVAFGRDVLAHLDARTPGVHVTRSGSASFPASAVLAHEGTELRLLDDGDLVTVMAFTGSDKGGCGTGVRLADVQAFARALAALEAQDGQR